MVHYLGYILLLSLLLQPTNKVVKWNKDADIQQRVNETVNSAVNQSVQRIYNNLKRINMNRGIKYNENNIKLLTTALGEYDTAEKKGGIGNSRIVEYSHSVGHTWVKTDQIAWCSSFINWVAKTAGYEYTKKLNARSWLDIGTEVSEDDWSLGDVVILWRGSKNSWQGHCSIYIRETETHVYLLGGNQTNTVNISKYPKSRILGVRRLNKISDEIEVSNGTDEVV